MGEIGGAEIAIEFVYDCPQENAEDCSGEAFALENALGDEQQFRKLVLCAGNEDSGVRWLPE